METITRIGSIDWSRLTVRQLLVNQYGLLNKIYISGSPITTS